MVSDVMRILDRAMELTNQKIRESKDDRERQGYEDYRRHIRELGTAVYTLIGKMRMDRILDPIELESLEQLGNLGLKVAEEPLK